MNSEQREAGNGFLWHQQVCGLYLS